MKYYFNASSEYCNKSVELYVYNLTSSYTDQRNEAPMVATSVVMFILAALFFNLNLFSRFSDVSAILNPSVRLFLNTSLSLFLPVMSYLFSEAKNDSGAGGQMTELSVRARTILMWMLLVELLRRKVEEILVTAAGAQGYSGNIERATRIAWLGYLVFYNLRSAGKKALYGILWVFAAAKMVQRFVSQELGKRSFAYGKNPQLLSSYMTRMLQDGGEEHESSSNKGSELLKRCNYVVMGEEELQRKAGPDGYDLVSLAEALRKRDSSVVTVGKIWKLADDNKDKLLRKDPRLKRLCLSFALFKLLRRRLEDFPISSEEARSCHHLIFKGLCEEEEGNATEDGTGSGRALFQVLNNEVQFLCEYYHSVQPVVFASPFFFLTNYILFPVIVWALSILTIILCSHGDVSYAFRSFKADNYAVSVGVMKLMGCILPKITTSPPELFTVVDLSVTGLLLLALAYEEVWEFIVFLLSNWFMVSLVCSYTSKPGWRDSPFLSGVIRRILWVRDRLSRPNVCVKQLSLLWCHCRRLSSALLPTKAVPLDAKKALMARLRDVSDDAPLSNGRSALHQQAEELSWACESGSIAEVILTWHLATEMLAAKHPAPKKQKPAPGAGCSTTNNRNVGMALSRYGAYLVAFHPELLADETDGTKRVYRETKEELRKGMGWLGYYCSGQGARLRKLMEMAAARQNKHEPPATALGKGAKLGKALIDKATGRDEPVWKLVAEVWTEVVAYAAPTGSEQHVKAHREALALGGEFITVLWALTTHTGIARGGPVTATPATSPAFV